MYMGVMLINDCWKNDAFSDRVLAVYILFTHITEVFSREVYVPYSFECTTVRKERDVYV